MKYLIVHDAAPGQFVHIYKHLLKAGDHDILVASRKGSTLRLPVKQVVYDLPENLAGPDVGFADKAIGLGLNLYRELKPMAISGWVPDVILSHASRGASYFLKDLFPDARMVSLFEWYYGMPSPAEVKTGAALRQKCRSAAATNMPILRDFELMDAGYVPTEFQRAQFPRGWQSRLEVLHDGVDTDLYRPASSLTLEVSGKRFRKGDEIMTYAGRGMEHTRGFMQFMAAAAKVQGIRPNLHVLIAGADRICYDGKKGPGLKARAEEEIPFDKDRTHFVGLLPEAKFVSFLQISSLHVYLTRPFVLSWSMLNAMSVGAPVLGSDTAPVREVIRDGENGRLIDMNNADALADAMDRMLGDRAGSAALGKTGRATILEKYDLKKCLQRQLELMHGQ
ncbi:MULTISPECIES: glycosyltransferase [Kordiimonas]|uniref:glycosyltransferase n=1 Tax=Kordiimonas TaxID=288021 RepID=UPI00257BE426|nr:glycosyltransferase [Kordiimonas sp. UBA4487]